MGQYFKAVNVSKQEVVCHQCLNGGLKYQQWDLNTLGALFTLLLCKQNQNGGGDFREALLDTLPKALVGRWAGDHIVLVGGAGSGNLWDMSKRYRNISFELAGVWNRFIGSDDLQLRPFEFCQCLPSGD